MTEIDLMELDPVSRRKLQNRLNQRASREWLSCFASPVPTVVLT